MQNQNKTGTDVETIKADKQKSRKIKRGATLTLDDENKTKFIVVSYDRIKGKLLLKDISKMKG